MLLMIAARKTKDQKIRCARISPDGICFITFQYMGSIPQIKYAAIGYMMPAFPRCLEEIAVIVLACIVGSLFVERYYNI